MTEWLDIPGFEGAYQVSSSGQVRSVAREVPRGGPYNQYYFNTVPERILKPLGPLKNRVNLYRDREMRSIRIDVLVAQAFGTNKV